MSWYRGNQPTTTECLSCWKASLISRSLCIRFPWLTMTPLGVAVEPEVYWRNASVRSLIDGSCQRSLNAGSSSSVRINLSAWKSEFRAAIDFTINCIGAMVRADVGWQSLMMARILDRLRRRDGRGG